VFVDKVAAIHLEEGRKTFRDIGLARRSLVMDNDILYLFPWRGTSTLDALRLALRQFKLPVTPATFCLMVPAREEQQLRQALQSLAEETCLDGAQLAHFDENLERAKYDRFVPRDLLRQAAAIDRLDAAAVPQVCRELLSQ
jgi:ATP-dependent Lhr-like helicase